MLIFLKMNNGQQPPVIHVDSTAPLYSDKTKKLITDKIWGIYYKPDIEGLGCTRWNFTLHS